MTNEDLAKKLEAYVSEEASSRPTETPDGLPFPYVHWGTYGQRVDVLRETAETLDLSPEVVLNVGCGYDVSTTDAFPEARVVYVDIAPQIVSFLRECGFEAYEPSEVPGGLHADLAINFLGPGIHDEGMLNDHVHVISQSSYPGSVDGLKLIAAIDLEGKVTRDVSELEALKLSNDFVGFVFER